MRREVKNIGLFNKQACWLNVYNADKIRNEIRM